MAGFIRRYSSVPGDEITTLIEGVIIVDLPPPGSIQGLSTGVVACVGEFADVTYGVAVSNGAVTTKPQPVEVLSSQDLIDKVGGFDELLGNFGLSGGNAYVDLVGKKFSRLICVPVNVASPTALRCYRQLPGCTAAGKPDPVVPMQGAMVAAAREFKTTLGNRVRLRGKVVFTDDAAYHQGTDGTVALDPAGAVQNFDSATGDFVNKGVKAGDALVLEVVGQNNAGTYRVVSVVSGTRLSVEKQDGSSFVWIAAAGKPWRLHVATAADSGGNYSATQTPGYTVPAQPLDANVAAATALTPTVIPPAATATTWDPLSGVRALVQQGGVLAYDATVQAANAGNHFNIDTLYTMAIDGLLGEDLPQREVNIGFASRISSTIRAKGKAHELDASGSGVGRLWVNAPGLGTMAVADAIADADPGAGANRDEGLLYTWPGIRQFTREAVGTQITGADGKKYTDGYLDVPAHSTLASVLSNIAPERNPGEATQNTKLCLSHVAALQRGVSNLSMQHYILMRQKGICGLRMTRKYGAVFQSGVTTSLVAGQKNIARRRMAYFIQDSISERLMDFSKQPLTTQLKDAALGEVFAFLNGLLSPDNPSKQRINAFSVDGDSGNTTAAEAQGIYVILINVQTTPTADFIVLTCSIGESVVVTVA